MSWQMAAFSLLSMSHSREGGIWIHCPATIHMIVGLKWVFLQSRDWTTIGRKAVSMTPSCQLNLGSNVDSQGYPKIRSSFPRSVTKKCIFHSSFPVCTSRSMKWVSWPPQLVVLSIFQIFHGWSRACDPNPSRLRSFGWMKLSVAPESTKIFLLAMACNVLNETDRKSVV